MSVPRLLVFALACIPVIGIAQVSVGLNDFKGKVSSIRSTTYFVPTGTQALKKELIAIEQERRLDRSRQLLFDKTIHHKVEGVPDTSWVGEEVCTYNKKGQLLERRGYLDFFTKYWHSVRTYDDKGRLTELHGKALHYGDLDTSWKDEEHIYNETGKQVRRITNDKTYPRSIEYYSGSERLDSAIAFGKDNNVAGRTLVKYDASGNEIERLFPGIEDPDRRWTFKYNSKGQKVEENSYRGRVIYKYDDKGNEIESVQYDDDGTLHESVTKTYNEQGYLVKALTDNRSQSPEHTFYLEEEYTDFDKMGNSLKKTERWVKKHSEKTYVTVYEIKYYN